MTAWNDDRAQGWKNRVQGTLDEDNPAAMARLVGEGLDPDAAYWEASGGPTTLAGRVIAFLVDELSRTVARQWKPGDHTADVSRWAQWQRPWLDALDQTGFSWDKALIGGQSLFLNCMGGHWRAWALQGGMGVDGHRWADGRTALLCAGAGGDVEAMCDLAGAGANPSLRDARGLSLVDITLTSGEPAAIAQARSLTAAHLLDGAIDQATLAAHPPRL